MVQLNPTPSMKIVYVGDFKGLPNWGCRATGAALAQMIESEHSIVDRIGLETLHGTGWDRYAEPPVVYRSFIPRRFFDYFWRNRNGHSRWARAYFRLSKLLGEKLTFLCEDPDESVEQFHIARKSNPRLQEIQESIESCDALVFNGEGTMIFSTPSRNDVLYNLFLIRLGTVLGKKVYFLNCMFSDCPHSQKNEKLFAATVKVLTDCTMISCRDRESYELITAAAPNANVTTIPDALFSWQSKVRHAAEAVSCSADGVLPFGYEHLLGAFDFSQPYICLSGSSSANLDSNRVAAYCAVAKGLQSLGLPIYLVGTCDGDWFLGEVSKQTGLPLVPHHIPVMSGAGIVAGARLLVSGRFHPSIMASLGGTPTVMFGSNSHKTRSLQKVLGYEKPREFSHVPTEAEVPEIVKLAGDMLDGGLKQRQKIETVASQRCQQSQAVLDLLRGRTVTPML